MKREGLLPIGSVVLLANSTRRLMIIGYGQQKIDDETKLYDYAGCLYPEGYVGPESTFLFNDEQIERLYAYGYADDQAIDYIPRVEQAIQEVREGR